MTVAFDPSRIFQTVDFFGSHLEAILALCALFLTIYQSLLTRKHNRLSVKPKLSSFTDFQRPFNSTIIYSVKVVNRGLGPAYINRFRIIYEDKEYEITEIEHIHALVLKEFGGQLDGAQSYYGFLRKGAVLGNADSFQIANLFLSVANDDEARLIPSRIAKFNMIMDYESAYKEKDSYDTRRDVDA